MPSGGADWHGSGDVGNGWSCPSLTHHLACTRRAVCSHQVQERKLQNFHLYGGTGYPLFSSANLTCRQNGGLEPAIICHNVVAPRLFDCGFITTLYLTRSMTSLTQN